MSSPLISIILPTYNGAKYLRKSIESCLQQSFTDFELIVVNDCSTDNTLEIAKEFAAKDDRIKIINNEFNKKLPLSLNTGFEAAKGDYFTWTSDDNFYSQVALEKMLAEFQQDEKTDLLYCDYLIINDEDKVTGKRVFGDVNQSFIKWLGAGACFLYKREVHFAINGYNPAAFLIEDYDFFCRAFTRFTFKYLPLSDLYYYREHDDSLTARNTTIINDISKIFLERNINALAQKLTANEMNLVYRKMAVYYAVSKNNTEKLRFYLQKMAQHSKGSAWITIAYISVQKIIKAFFVIIKAIGTGIGLLFQKNSE